jgi:hypothetical protein
MLNVIREIPILSSKRKILFLGGEDSVIHVISEAMPPKTLETPMKKSARTQALDCPTTSVILNTCMPMSQSI